MLLTERWCSIDWQAPWWLVWRALGQRVAASAQAGKSLHEALNAMLDGVLDGTLDGVGVCPIRFVSQSDLPEGAAYEAFIFETKTVPTRDNLHDFFNGLAWLRFPLTKARLNAMQYAEIEKNGVQQLRGPLRDALTLFDENAAFLCAQRHAPVIEALRRRDWQAAFHTHRHVLQAYPPILFGHALLEKLASPYKSITAHVFPVQAAHVFVAPLLALSEDAASPNDALAQLDSAVAAQLEASSLLPKPFVPLPVLGVPLWWPANEEPHFYTDRAVFRLPRP